MDPQIIDYYNEMPSEINVIDKMNEELTDLQKQKDELENKYKEYIEKHRKITYDMPKIRLNTLDELKVYGKKIHDSHGIFHKIIYDFLEHKEWILEYDRPDGATTNILGYAKCGYWDTLEIDTLKWDDTTADEFYYGYAEEDGWRGEYNIYLKCKILDELYKLFPEYENREYGWFQKELDRCFQDIENILVTIITRTSGGSIMWQLYDIIYQSIMEQLFGWGEETGDFDPDAGFSRGGIFPGIYDNSDYIQNIIYYQCDKCNKYTVGEDAMGNHDECDRRWYIQGDDSEVCKCKCNA